MSEEDFSVVLGLHMKQLREHAQLSQEQLAERMKVHHNTIWKWEQGQGRMPTIAFLKFCAVLHADAGKVLRQILHDDC